MIIHLYNCKTYSNIINKNIQTKLYSYDNFKNQRRSSTYNNRINLVPDDDKYTTTQPPGETTQPPGEHNPTHQRNNPKTHRRHTHTQSPGETTQDTGETTQPPGETTQPPSITRPQIRTPENTPDTTTPKDQKSFCINLPGQSDDDIENKRSTITYQIIKGINKNGKQIIPSNFNKKIINSIFIYLKI